MPEQNRAIAFAPTPRQTPPVVGEPEPPPPPTSAVNLFKLDGLGVVSDFPHSGEFDPVSGRVAIGDSIANTIHIFNTPALTVFNVEVLDQNGVPANPVQVCAGEPYKIRFSVTVPEWKSPAQNVTPQLTIDGTDALSMDASVEAGGDYGTSNVGPVSSGDVLTYTYSLTAGTTTGSIPISATATGDTTSLPVSPLTDVGVKEASVPFINCAAGQPPTITVDSVTYGDESPLVAGEDGWLKVEPAYASLADQQEIDVNINLLATTPDLDATLDNITYQLSGTNQGTPQTVDISEPPVTTYTLPVRLTLSGVTGIEYQTQDSNSRPSTVNNFLVKLDNSLPGSCFTFSGGVVKTPTERWWNNTVVVNLRATDTHDEHAQLTSATPVPLTGSTLVFTAEGAGQFSTVTITDHVGHVRELDSNTKLDVCNPGDVGEDINIDTTVPTASPDVAGGPTVHQSPLTVTIAGVDPLSSGTKSDVRWIEYRFGTTGPFTTVDGNSASVQLVQSTVLQFHAVDWAGNIGATEEHSYIVNRAPVAVDNAYTTNEDVATSGNVLTDGTADSDADGDTLTVTTVGVFATAHGSVTLSANGSFTYTPQANYHGGDSFDYAISDGRGGSDTATGDAHDQCGERQPGAGQRHGGDRRGHAGHDPIGHAALERHGRRRGALTIVSVQGAVNGTVVLNPDGTSVTFTPAANFAGPTGSFTYTVSDGNGGSGTGTVTVTVTAVNDAPLANDDTATTDEDTAITIQADTLLANDTDVDVDSTLTITSAQDAVNGTVVLNPGGTSVTFTPTANFNGPASFTYTVSDGSGGSDMASVAVTVTPVNENPVANDDTANTNEDTALTIAAATLLENDTDVDGTLTITSVQDPVNGTVSLSGSTVTFTPAANYSGPAASPTR